ncbi:TPA: T3SS effector protein NleD [Morganella morganii subsp. morganii]|uniref:T3SS effector protein NleD n=1 Tax=Morganella morganii TaxID=582 RepID=A0AAU8ZQT6_MORMO|nr:M91 family zinc metallopeptidase [Morganella morganii]HDU8691664.1 T3SS effector protein NleD [Morganella morganii subsp. morganii]AWC95230.1 T3SS effector protein NleD [Morganella morganii]EKW8486473.1 T3SS effector protein NleD [Morganella morganii]HAT3624150.1 T3SS effector protein NleD [Morganella morganii]HCU0876778.1 T3SS effector protein NleD [Morganella morganii]
MKLGSVTASPAPDVSFSPENLAECRKTSDVSLIRYCENLVFKDSNFTQFLRFNGAMGLVNSTDSGRILLNCIETLLQFKSEKLMVYLASPELGTVPHQVKDAENGRGTGADLHCNFNLAEHRNGEGLSEKQFHAAILYHELVHVLHCLRGECIHDISADSSEDLLPSYKEAEEDRTIGIGAFTSEAISENIFRTEIGVPLRNYR